MTASELITDLESAIRELDEERHRMVAALHILKPDSKVVQLPLPRGPRPRLEKAA